MAAVSSRHASAPGEAAAALLPLGKVFGVSLGNALEYYDWLTFSFFSVQISHAFFPVTETSHGLLYALAIFGVGFFMRPVGAIVIGGYGDRVGRRPAMVLSFFLMGVAITGLALTPSYARIGIAAPILLLACRLLQGFALGGETGPTTAYLVEAAAPRQRGLYVSLQFATADLAVLMAGIVGFVLSGLLDAASLDAWGWRVAFLLGAAVVPVGLALRRSLPETLHAYPQSEPAGTPPRVPLRLVAAALMILAAATLSNYGINYMTTYAQDSLHMATRLAFGATMVGGLCAVACDLASGFLSDRLGRKPVMLAGVAALIAVIFPAYLLMTRFPTIAMVYTASALLGGLQALATGAGAIAITEALPRAVRARALGTILAVATALFGGTTQFTLKWLIDTTGSNLAPAWYMTVALVIGMCGMVMIPETAPVKTGRSED